MHLADALPDARSVAAPAPSAERNARHWRFDEARPEWLVQGAVQSPRLAAVTLQLVDDATRLSLRAPDGSGGGMLMGGLVTALEPTPLSSWAALRVRARTHERLSGMLVAPNAGESGNLPRGWSFMMGGEGTAPVFGDGSVQDYLLPLRAPEASTDPAAAPPLLSSLGLFVGAPGEGSLDILEVTLVPRGAEFTEAVGVLAVARAGESRHSIYAHAPAELAFALRVPAQGRLDLGLAGLSGETVTHRVAVRTQATDTVLLEERLAGGGAWAQRSVDLSRWAGQEVELLLEARAESELGAVALWGAPLVSGAPAASSGAGASAPSPSARPNVLFYVIDGGGADQMSVYGYERETTPFLSELAQQGVVFEAAFATATWTQPSTASFMTGLHHSVLGGLRRGLHSTPVPSNAVTMAEHFRLGGWFTTSLTTNPNCARVIGLQRGVDVLDDTVDSGHGGGHATSSTALHDRFFALRAQYPAQPWWAHIQTTDVHEPNEPVAPFAGRFLPEAEREQLDAWEEQLDEAGDGLFGRTSIAHFYDEALRRAGLDRHAYYDGRRSLYDETMLHQDASLRDFVERLQAAGEWSNTLLVIASDHGHPAGTFARWGRGLFEPSPPEWEGALFDSYSTRVPLLVIWPGHLPGGRRIAEPVSMIDVLPTLLDLAGLPPAEFSQGRSLAAALRGAPLAPAPVLFDEVRVDEASGVFVGNLEAIDGRWGASLEIGPASRGRHAVPAGGRWGAVHPFFPEAPRLLLYDLHADRFARRAVNDEHPELVVKYEQLLRERWAAHLLLAQRFTASEAAPLSPEELEQLKALGYTR
ncbi:MAG: sulfatase family protein [Planctomycetota bacterium]